MERGYVKLWRKTLDSGLMQTDNAFRLFGYLLMNVAFTEKKVSNDGQVATLYPGQAIFSRKRVSNFLNISEQCARTALKFLEKLEIITSKSTNRFTIVSFVNWDTYNGEKVSSNQQTNHYLTNSQPTVNQQLTTVLECKNVNNINKNTSYSLSSGDDATQPTLLDGMEKPSSEGKSNIPSCPHGEIVKLYHETLPMMPKIKVWDSGRQGGLRWCWKNRYDDGKYKTAEEGLVYWKSLFEHIRDKCPWLTGQIEGRDGRAFTKCNLAWIVKRANFIKIIEGNYDQKEVA